jgi:PAS domain S-box-containing protein/putative nucleotidyltransferase with HDIG domain
LNDLDLALHEIKNDFISRYRLGDGEVRDIEVFRSPITLGGRNLLYSVFQDITEKKKSEESQRLQAAALNASANAILMTDSSGIVEWANPAFTQLTGWSLGECIGQGVGNITTTGLSDTPVCSGGDCRQAICAKASCELTEHRKDGSSYIEEKVVRTVQGAGNAVEHYVIIKQDITEKVQRRRELEVELAISGIYKKANSREGIRSGLMTWLSGQFGLDNIEIRLEDVKDGDGASPIGMGRIDGVGAIPDVMNSDLKFQIELKDQERHLGCLTARFRDTPTPLDLHLLSIVATSTAETIATLDLRNEKEERVRQIAAMSLIDKSITGTINIWVTLGLVLDQAMSLLAADAMAIFLLNKKTDRLQYTAGRGFRTDLIADGTVGFGESLIGIAAAERRTISTSDISLLNPQSAFMNMVKAEGFSVHQCTPLVAQNRVVGVLEAYHRRSFVPGPDWLSFFETIARQTAIAVDNNTLLRDLQRANEDLEEAYEATIEGWSKAMELRDRETEGHTQRVTTMAVALARRMGVPDAQMLIFRRGALLHDIGKIGVPDAILNKPGPLDEDEWVIMKKHPFLAFDMLSPISYLRDSLDIPWCHHEWWDGNGYPRGLKGEAIPLAARIFIVADVWDALTSDRPYRAAWPPQKAIDSIEREAGTHFDPEVVRHFSEMLVELGYVGTPGQ